MSGKFKNNNIVNKYTFKIIFEKRDHVKVR